MNKSKLLSAALVVAIATTTASCHIYKKFEMPEEGIAGEVAGTVLIDMIYLTSGICDGYFLFKIRQYFLCTF